MTRTELEDTLARYGIRPGLRSSMQTVELLEKILWEPAYGTMMDGYAVVGRRYGVRPVQVERNVHARILHVWRTGDDRLLQSCRGEHGWTRPATGSFCMRWQRRSGWSICGAAATFCMRGWRTHRRNNVYEKTGGGPHLRPVAGFALYRNQMEISCATR